MQRRDGTGREESFRGEDLLPSLRERLAAERGFRGRMRSLRTPVRVVLAAAALAAVAAVAGTAMLRPDLAAWSTARFLLSIAGLAGLALLATAVFLRPLSSRPVGRRTAASLTGAALLLPAVLAALPAAHGGAGAVPGSYADLGGAFFGAAAKCLLLGSAFALPLLGILWLVDRRDGPAGGRILLAAGLGGLAGNLALLLHCPLVSPSHLLLGHATIPLFLALLLAGAARRRCNRR